jgi:acyl-CoA reductase-like NAD-dependent aldehyde dehydrogenase
MQLSQTVQDTFAAATRSGVIECYDPATRAVLGQVQVTPAADVARIVARAREAQRGWARTSFETRRKMLRALLDYTLAHADALCEEIMRDSGKTRENALLGEIWPVCAKLRWTIAHGERWLKPERMSAGLFAHKRALVEFQPLGVIGVITPWNYPYQNIMGPTIHALMAGNAVVVKPSEWVAWSSQGFQRVFDQAFDAVGQPRELVSLVQGYAETGKALIQGGVDKVVFTGSQPNGRRVMEAAVPTLTPVILELGGKDPLIVCEDAHLEQAVHATLAGVFINSGQNCLAAERVLVHDAIYQAFEDRIVKEVAALRQGPPGGPEPVDMAAIVSPLQLDRIEALVDRAVAEGARVLVGGKRVHVERGQYYAPTVLADVTPQMEIMREEMFGPVLLLCRVRDDAHALELANGTGFGLGATVLSKSRARARALRQGLVAGQVSINDFGLTYMAQDLPFGGVRGSGFGRLNGREGLRGLTNPKAVLEDRFPLHFPAKVYPVGPHDYARARAAMQLLYGRGGARLRGLGALLLPTKIKRG